MSSPRDTKGAFPRLKWLWTLLGEPFPRFTRFVRYGVIGRWNSIHVVSAEDKTVAVIIPCHNYGRFLAETIESVLNQSCAASDIVVVDDASTDNTAAVAQSYAARGVRYIRGEWKNVGKARNAGLQATTAPYLIFLDADDVLHRHYIRAGLKALHRFPEAGIACSHHETFGHFKRYHLPPTKLMDADALNMHNPIHAGAMVRRQALVQIHGWSEMPNQHNDWLTWRRILQLGWKAVRTNGVYYYRIHGNSMMDNMRERHSYAEQAGLLTEGMTLCISLSGRTWMWPLTRQFLETQTYPHDLTRLVILDTSHDPAFGREVREWLSKSDYVDTTYRTLKVGEKGIADRPRREVEAEIGVACSIIYNTIARMVTTPLTLIVEDDVIPPVDVFQRLARSLEVDVISVSGLYWHRTVRQPVCWEWNEYDKPVFAQPSHGVQPVGGTGFGCLLIRSSALHHHVFHSGAPHRNYDENFFATVRQNKEYKVLIDWDCVCLHYQSADAWV